MVQVFGNKSNGTITHLDNKLFDVTRDEHNEEVVSVDTDRDGYIDKRIINGPKRRVEEAALNDEQRKMLEEWTSNLMTRNSVADIDRLKDSLVRWDELFMDPAEPEMKPVFAILKERVRERIAAFEAEVGAGPE